VAIVLQPPGPQLHIQRKEFVSIFAVTSIEIKKSFEITKYKEHSYVESLHEVMFGHNAMRRRVRVLGNALQIIPSPLSVMLDLDM
jgi:uncharacterized membrane protein YecN with MAPEG domain